MIATAWSTLETPLGPMAAAAADDGIVRLAFADGGRAVPAAHGSAAAHLSWLADELSAYFAGRLTAFTVPLAVVAGTPFQRAAWAYLRSIPFGQTRTYGRQAAALGSPTAARAVGGANGANPLCLVVPCHRVIGSNGGLTGFAAGVDRKRWLLDHERAVSPGCAPDHVDRDRVTRPARVSGPGRTGTARLPRPAEAGRPGHAGVWLTAGRAMPGDRAHAGRVDGTGRASGAPPCKPGLFA